MATMAAAHPHSTCRFKVTLGKKEGQASERAAGFPRQGDQFDKSLEKYLLG